MKRGSLIAIEGLDRTGKTTQTEYLLNKFKELNIKHKLVKFPQRDTQIGKLINQYLTDKSFELSDEATHLIFSANRWELASQIKDDLNNGINIVLDRYVYSGVAYSSAKGLDFEWCLSPDKGLPKPDVTIFLKFQNIDEISTRKGFGDERYEVAEFQDKVRMMFEKFENNKEFSKVFVDNLGKEEVHNKIWRIIKPLSEGCDEELSFF